MINSEKLTRTQIKKGFAILAGFMILRVALVRLWLLPFNGSVAFRVNIHCFIFIGTAFLVVSVGLVYFGFTRWVGVDLKKWWFNREKVWGDIAWACGILIAFVALTSSISQFIPDLFHIQRLMTLFFAFTVKSFNEETLFRGFLQPVLTEKFGPWRANFVQAALFSLSHIGIAPMGLSIMSVLLVITFVSGLVFGWLTMKRGRLLAAGALHGFLS
ncbi:lysostaphin resistance A-like protein [Candidatus Hydrogenedentota bacterium]